MPSLATRLTTSLSLLLEQRHDLTTQLASIQTRLTEINGELKTRAADAGGKLETEDFLVTLVEASQHHLDKEKLREHLLEAGVKAAVVRACLQQATKTTSYSYPRVTEKPQEALHETAPCHPTATPGKQMGGRGPWDLPIHKTAIRRT